jgi:hypothetical protein
MYRLVQDTTIQQWSNLTIETSNRRLHLATSTADDMRKTLFLTMLTDDHGREQCSA